MTRAAARKTFLTAAAIAACSVLALSGCTGQSPEPSATAGTASGTPSPSPTPSPTPTPTPTLDPELDAAGNLPYFDLVNTRTLAEKPTAKGQDFIDGLVAAGFDKADMQLTADRTSANLTANSIQFSVKINGSCLIGQNGKDSDGYHGMAAPLLETGKCLVGKTVPIK